MWAIVAVREREMKPLSNFIQVQGQLDDDGLKFSQEIPTIGASTSVALAAIVTPFIFSLELSDSFAYPAYSALYGTDILLK